MKLITELRLKYYTQKLNLEMKKKINSSLPIGSIIPYASNNIPHTYLACDGSEISRAEYADLFNIIGTVYGAGDGSTTFNLPNLKGRVPLGVTPGLGTYMLGDALGSTEHQHDFAIATTYSRVIPAGVIALENGKTSHKSSVTMAENVAINSNKALVNEAWNYGDGNKVKSVGSTSKSSNIQPSLVVNYIIKAKYDVQTVQDLNVYSLDEQRVGTWYDGKPLYRKCFSLTTKVGSNKIDVSNLNIGFFVGVSGQTKQPAGNFCSFSYKLNDEDYCNAYYNSTAKQMIINCGTKFGFGDSKLVIEYTKTTDWLRKEHI